MKQSCWKWFKLLFCFILMNLFLFGLSKTETGAKTWLLRRAGANFSSRVTLATSGAGVVCHMNRKVHFFADTGFNPPTAKNVISFFKAPIREDKGFFLFECTTHKPQGIFFLSYKVE